LQCVSVIGSHKDSIGHPVDTHSLQHLEPIHLGDLHIEIDLIVTRTLARPEASRSRFTDEEDWRAFFLNPSAYLRLAGTKAAYFFRDLSFSFRS
jgi:hypothetical protein